MEYIGVVKEVDALGRICIPKDMRNAVGLTKEVELLVTSDGLLIRSPQYKLVKITENT